ncbi:MAG: hypothetical protein AAFP67_04385 [Pseudomonadota bacterium]
MRLVGFLIPQAPLNFWLGVLTVLPFLGLFSIMSMFVCLIVTFNARCAVVPIYTVVGAKLALPGLPLFAVALMVPYVNGVGSVWLHIVSGAVAAFAVIALGGGVHFALGSRGVDEYLPMALALSVPLGAMSGFYIRAVTGPPSLPTADGLREAMECIARAAASAALLGMILIYAGL